jgi:hypothetical protein
MVDHSGMKLGKNAPRHETRTLQMAHYLLPEALPGIPDSQTWYGKVGSWPMMMNDRLGDCTCAAAGHFIEEWTAYSGQKTILSDEQIVAAYSTISGYDPRTGKNDNGAVELDVLKYWKNTGFAGHKILAFVGLEPENFDHIKASVFLFGGCYIGMALPLSAQTQGTWSVPPGGVSGTGAPGSWGGHAVPVVGYDAHGLTVVTWGALKRMTWGFWQAYCDEAYALLSPDWLDAGNSAANGFDLDQLEKDLVEVGKS